MAKKANTPKYIESVGRRKTATARVRLYPTADTKKEIKIWDYKLNPGVIIVNKKPVKEYFPGKVGEQKYKEPFRITNTSKKYAATVQISGSGLTGQLEAMIHGIARALDKADPEKHHDVLKEKDLLTRDPRMKERRKPGLAQSARAQKQSPKR